MMKKKRFLFYSFILIIFFSLNVKAASFGVSPAIYEVDFESGLERSFEFNFVTDVPDLDFIVNVTGELSQYVTLDKNEFSGNSGKIIATLKLPQRIDIPGPHRIFVGALPKSNNLGRSGGATVGITTRVNGVIKVLVPYPGQYADVEFKIMDTNAGEKAKYKLVIYSRGREDIVTNSRIEIYDSTNKSVGVFDVGSDIIQSIKKVEINLELDVASLEAGNYKAVAIVSYAEVEKKVEDTFRLGELFVGIVNYTKEFERNQINPIYIDIESGWNDPIPEVYATGSYRSNYSIGFQTPSVELGPWKERRLVGHFDTSSIEEDKFQMDLTLHYGNKTTEKIADLRLKEKKFNYLFWGGITLGILIVIGFITWVVVKLRRLERKSEKRKK